MANLCPQILILSDSDPFAQAITALLRKRWTTGVYPLDQPRLPEVEVSCELKLVILALSQAIYDPVVVLHQTNILRLVGNIPLIIISLAVQKPGQWPDDRVWHLDFPPDWSRLWQVVTAAIDDPQPAVPATARIHQLW